MCVCHCFNVIFVIVVWRYKRWIAKLPSINKEHQPSMLWNWCQIPIWQETDNRMVINWQPPHLNAHTFVLHSHTWKNLISGITHRKHWCHLEDCNIRSYNGDKLYKEWLQIVWLLTHITCSFQVPHGNQVFRNTIHTRECLIIKSLHSINRMGACTVSAYTSSAE